MNEIYLRIEALCRSHKMNITEMCKKCAIPRASLTDFKMGRIKTLSASTLQKIAEYFSVSVEYLLSGEAPRTDEINPSNLKIALFGGEDGLAFYRVISRIWKPCLKVGGMIAFEIGDTQGEAVANILTENGYKNAAVRKDYEDRDRVVTGFKF